MSLLIETISCIDGKLQNLFWHSLRVNKSRNVLINSKQELVLNQIPVPDFAKKGKWKCKIWYDEIINKINFEPYQLKKIQTLKIIESNVNYKYKYNNRTELNELYKKRGNCDEIIIIKNELVTDTSIANILLYDGKKWLTPEYPLLEGTMRANLMSKKLIFPTSIEQANLFTYHKIMLINAMNPFDEARALDVSRALV